MCACVCCLQIPAITADEMAAAAIQRGAREPVSERQELQKLFDSVMQEIEERRTFLRDMEGAGRLSREMRHQVRVHMWPHVSTFMSPSWLINWRPTHSTWLPLQPTIGRQYSFTIHKRVCVCVTPQIHCEIKQRVAEMERLDQIINEREDRARREAGLPPRT